MKITLRQLEIFSAIATHGHVTRAAEAVSMTQSAASMALAELEQQLAPVFAAGDFQQALARLACLR